MDFPMNVERYFKSGSRRDLMRKGQGWGKKIFVSWRSYTWAFQIRKVCNFLEISILLLHLSTSTEGSALDLDYGGEDQTKDYQG